MFDTRFPSSITYVLKTYVTHVLNQSIVYVLKYVTHIFMITTVTHVLRRSETRVLKNVYIIIMKTHVEYYFSI